ncbi:unnamed protein product [Heligmosomoides polygyrus]|uniref:Yippee domain-containing protein n=1 Tax=Heligmosomoides polygyrus TaxID=6339 RepID=A0A183G3Z5_HELPZ|nr:unnamed protein product [Heligmosomoides polygyrus]
MGTAYNFQKINFSDQSVLFSSILLSSEHGGLICEECGGAISIFELFTTRLPTDTAENRCAGRRRVVLKTHGFRLFHRSQLRAIDRDDDDFRLDDISRPK